MAENERDFKGVWIPKAVWLDARLSALDKIILTEIDSLDQGERGCYASNKYIADFCQCSESKVSKSIAVLIKCGYLYVNKFDGRQRELKSSIAENTSLPSKKCQADKQKMLESNIYNKTINNTSNIKDIVEYLNSKAGTAYKTNTAKTQTLIKARMAEGFTEQDFKTVIDKMIAKWQGTDMAQYLRPETLFGTKFEGYLNSPAKGKITTKTVGANGIAIDPTKTDLDDLF